MKKMKIKYFVPMVTKKLAILPHWVFAFLIKLDCDVSESITGVSANGCKIFLSSIQNVLKTGIF